MNTWFRTVCLAGAVGLLLVLTSACGKSIQATSGSKSFEEGKGTGTPQPVAKAPVAPGPAEPGVKEESLKPSGESPKGFEPVLPGPSAEEPLKGLEPVQPGAAPTEERLKSGQLIAKAEPADASRRQVEEMQREQAATSVAGLKDVFFAFDSWRLNEEAKQALSADAQWLKANPSKSVTIEGHCDERGTLSYNLVLGEKRAKAALNYLASFGVNPKQLAVASFGKERPFCKDPDEACYQQNRRAHLVVRAN